LDRHIIDQGGKGVSLGNGIDRKQGSGRGSRICSGVKKGDLSPGKWKRKGGEQLKI